jgi:hypothetical protein
VTRFEAEGTKTPAALQVAAKNGRFKISKRSNSPPLTRLAPRSVGEGSVDRRSDILSRCEDEPMSKDIRIVPEPERDKGQAITFVLAIGAVRQVGRLQTTFQTQNQAFSYFHKHRNAFERAARARFARGEIEDGVIQLTML